ncbi:MAG: ATP-binding cassette domain-containing protein [Tenericutes bacterium]|nr:ATP-binding cassette domain-containing protein [Mycoplasmatota bacterium]
MKIEVKNLTKVFKKNKVLDNISINFEEGKIYGLIGRNGSGKSVFLKLLCAFLSPTSGEILFDGKNIIKEQEFPPETRALIEKPSFLNDLSGYENLKLLASIQNTIGDKEIFDTLSKVELLPDKDKKYSEYSLGMKQKLGIAQVLMENPRVIILDEPFNGVEDKTADSLRKILLEEKNNNKIIIIATHIKEDIVTLVDELYKFDGGNITKEENI